MDYLSNVKLFAKLIDMETTTPARYSDVVAAFDELVDRDRPGRVLDLLARMLDLTDDEIAGGSGLTRQTINAKRRGKRRVRPEDVWPLSEALGIEWSDLLLEPANAAAKLLDKESARFRCTVQACSPRALSKRRNVSSKGFPSPPHVRGKID